MEAICIICGKKFKKRNAANTCCNSECAKKQFNITQQGYKVKKQQKKDLKKRKKEEFDADIKKASELNISYGIYIALKDGYL